MVNSLVARGGCRLTMARPLAGAEKLAGYLKSPYPANWAGVPDTPRGRKASKRAAEGFRRLGKHQNTPLKVSEASERPKQVV